MLRALLLSSAIDEAGKERISAKITSLDESDLPEGDVCVDIEHSTLNYKDGMIINGIGRLVRNYPHVPGVDFAGVVRSSRDNRYAAGDKVILTGWRVGETHWGGLAECACVNGDWLVPMPKNLNSRRAMAFGTAGFTAMLAIQTLEKNGLATDGPPVLVTGAAGGVGSVAVMILAQRGYHVVASTGRKDTSEWLKNLGASQIVDREELSVPSDRPLNKELYQACVDSVGGATLANVLTRIVYGGSVAAVGLAGGNRFEATVLPFLLRGVNILGIDSVMQPREHRIKVWNDLAALPCSLMDPITSEASLSEAIVHAKSILKGDIQGRLVIDVHA